VLADDATARHRLLCWVAEHVGELEADLILGGHPVNDDGAFDVGDLLDAAYARLTRRHRDK